MKRREQEILRYQQMLEFEQQALEQGYLMIAGVDEAGRGPLAGPVAAAACILDPSKPIYGLNDSKKLSAARRDQLYEEIIKNSLAYAVCMSYPDEIDSINILQATKKAMTEAVNSLEPAAVYLLLDAIKLEQLNQPALSLVKGDARSVSIAAASILAKVTRDRMMLKYDQDYPQYGFAAHKGYGTQQHYTALLEYGLTPIHRLSFLKNLEEKRRDDR